MLAIVADAARRAGAERLIGHYRPTAKNGMVRDLFKRLGFRGVGRPGTEGETIWELDLRDSCIAVPEYFSLTTAEEAVP